MQKYKKVTITTLKELLINSVYFNLMRSLVQYVTPYELKMCASLLHFKYNVCNIDSLGQ